ncbi:multifunctional transcriptional regulator/nicotinamide-nucleotide adenylyltransferase/ribosylnicotinamide kinase NadR [Planococcus ruber]|uniref:multifunctional transcriptional regulator/nicotinamide-nucleotide adenylyltransferase/ribosylnicotinamide kinase NadR n=1 Tax=Planococcus ruber TaxID=2027871 RepID=UPI002441096F|nr:multifunctional transcriptional regulator/nicotinamide-nucleotide adenylyltransferase/ribosylnicotinamide kinase NadR [Planococcus ruber]
MAIGKVGMYGGKFLIVHQGHVSAMIRASTMVEELHVMITHDEEYEKEFYFKGTTMKPIPFHQRLRWWNELTKDLPHVKVHAISEKQTGEFSDWEQGAESIKSAIGTEIDTVFSSEPEYGRHFEKLYPNAQHIVLDAERRTYPVSATQIREEGAMKHWAIIPRVVQPYFVRKIVVVGTESSGKSTLVKNLANLYNTSYVEEYGRTFYEDIGAEIAIESDFPKIAFEHKYHEEEQAKRANKLLFIDTEANVTQYFSWAYLGYEQPILDHVADLQRYDLWLFLEPDVEWVDDGMRSFGDPSVRQKNHAYLKGLLDKRGIRYHSISGDYNERLEKAIELVDEVLEEKLYS